jgi:hypothetical protein
VPFGTMAGASPAGTARKRGLEWISPRGVENGDLYTRAPSVHFGEEQIETVSVTSHLRFGRNLRIHRDHVRLPVRLNAVAAEKKERSRAWLDLAVEPIDGCAHRLFGEVLPDVDLEAVSPQFVSQAPGIIDRILQGLFRVRVSGIADDQCYPRFVLLRSNRMNTDCHKEGQNEK